MTTTEGTPMPTHPHRPTRPSPTLIEGPGRRAVPLNPDPLYVGEDTDPRGGAIAWLLLSLAVVLVIVVPIVVFALLGGHR
jgi:hypothetical protein